MSRIESLTPEQEARLAEFRDRWTAIGLSTEPADRPRAEAGIVVAYAAAGLKPPRIVWCGSPLSQGLTRAIILDKKLIDSVRDSVWASVGASVGDSVRDSVRASVGDSVRASGYGQHDANWIGFYAYFRDVLGLTAQTEKLGGMRELTESAGWYVPHARICWISERHNILQRDERGRLHSVAGPAVAYPDGWAIYAVHGVRVHSDVIEKPESVTVARIDAEQNAEVRRVMIERMGYERFLLESGAALIHSDETGSLYRKELPDDEPLVAVHVLNSTPEPDGSIKKYVLRVPPAVTTAREGVAWTFRMKAAEYRPQVET